MTNKLLSGTVIAAFAAILFSTGIATSYADSENSAQVITEGGPCIAFNAVGALIPADKEHWMQNKSVGNVTCHAYGVPNPSGEDITFTIGCGMGGKFGVYLGTSVNEIIDNGDGTANITWKCHTKAPDL